MAGWVVSGVSGLDDQLDKLIVAVDEATRVGITASAHVIEGNAKASFGPAHAKGTPKTVFDKPQSITGDLRRSIEVTEVFKTRMTQWTARIAPQMAYGRRIELGFAGEDSMKRVYDQPAYPYMEPGVRKSTSTIETLLTNAWQRALRS